MPAIDTSDIAQKVIAVFSLPRLMPTEIAFNAVEVASELGMRIRRRTGVFWGQSLTDAMNIVRDAGAEFILTIDYDTPHTPNDIRRIYALMLAYPRADAICGFQMRRNSNQILAAKREADGTLPATVPGYTFSQELVRIVSGHFGLTMIRTSSLDLIPKPWFHSVPDDKGEWGEGHIDEDMNFWRKFEAVGCSLFLAPRVPVAHMEWVRTWVGGDLKPLYQSEEDFEKYGVPESIRDGAAWIKK